MWFFRLPADGRIAVFGIHRAGFDKNGTRIRLTATVYPADRNHIRTNAADMATHSYGALCVTGKQHRSDRHKRLNKTEEVTRAAYTRPPAAGRHAARAHPRPASHTAQNHKQHRRRTERAAQTIVTAAAAGQLIQLAIQLAETGIHALGH